MSSDTLKPDIRFHCTRKTGGCGVRFTTSTYRTDPYPEREWHPYNHVAECPKCGEECEQAAHQLAAWKSAAQPKAQETRAAISAAQKARDPASYAVSRFNAITHGATAETAKYYPARPGHYDLCETCEYALDGCGTELKHCAKRTELFVQFALAQEEGNGVLLGKLMASTQAGLMAITADMIRAIARRGVEVETPIFTKGDKGIELATWQDAEGKERTITKLEAHPLLQPLIQFIHKNNMTLSDMNLTPAAKEETKQFQGFLDTQNAQRESLEEASRNQQQLVSDLLRVVAGPRVINSTGKVIDVDTDAG